MRGRPPSVGLSGGVTAPPGTRTVYSNLNYCLLGLLVEQIAGRPYEDVVKDRLLAAARDRGHAAGRDVRPRPVRR